MEPLDQIRSDQIMITTMDALLRAHWQRQHQIFRYAGLIVSIIVSAIATVLQPLYVRQPYHTSALTGAAWVLELLCGHPNRIRTELGVGVQTFNALIEELWDMGHGDSRYVSLEEQLSIFLYMSVTGLTIRHVGERFQRSNDTISRLVNSYILGSF
jgi:hypothetical protein